jgi:hypothetical protein
MSSRELPFSIVVIIGSVPEQLSYACFDCVICILQSQCSTIILCYDRLINKENCSDTQCSIRLMSANHYPPGTRKNSCRLLFYTSPVSAYHLKGGRGRAMTRRALFHRAEDGKGMNLHSGHYNPSASSLYQGHTG